MMGARCVVNPLPKQREKIEFLKLSNSQIINGSFPAEVTIFGMIKRVNYAHQIYENFN